MNTTANNTNSVDIDTKLTTMADSINNLGSMLAKFSSSVVSALSGIPADQLHTGQNQGHGQTQASSKRQAVTPGKKLGRPLGSKNKPKSIAPAANMVANVEIPRAPAVPRQIATPIAVPDAPAADKPLHPVAIELMNRVHREGRVKVSDLADQAKVPRSLVHYHLSPLIEKQKITVIRYSVGGKKVDVAYRPDRVLIRD